MVALFKNQANPAVGFKFGGRQTFQFNLWWRFLQIFSPFQSYEKIQLPKAGFKKEKKKTRPHNPPKTLFIDPS